MISTGGLEWEIGAAGFTRSSTNAHSEILRRDEIEGPGLRKMKVMNNPTIARAICTVLVLMLWSQALLGQTKVAFVDGNLERAIRDHLQKPVGDLTKEDLSKLTILTAPNYRIADLSGLEAASNLTDLNVMQNDITNVTAISGLPQLVCLVLSENRLQNLTPILGLTNLSRLFLDLNHLEAVPQFGTMPRLTELSLAYNHIRDPAPLRQLTSLRYLNLAENPISNLAPFCQMTNLQELNIANVGITNASELSCFSHLLSLHVSGTPISDWRPLAGLTNLQDLALTIRPGCDWAPIAALTNLTGLGITDASLTNAAWLGNLSRLTTLVFGGCSFNSLEWLGELESLKYLQFTSSSLPEFPSLPGLTNFSFLILNESPLTNYSGLAALTNLVLLSLEDNLITDLSFMPALPHLANLELSRNRIPDLTPLAGLTNLSSLNASFNRLTNISALTNLPQLRSVSLNGNLLNLTEGSDDKAIISGLLSDGANVYYQPQLERPQILIKPRWLLPAGQKSWLTFLLAEAHSWLEAPTLSAHSSANTMVEPGFITTAFSDYSPRYLSVVTAPDRPGTANITLAVTNYAGLWTNVSVEVQVVVPSTVNAESADAPGLSWRCGGNPPWFGQQTMSHDGVGAMQSGAADSWLQTTIKGPGTLRFWYRLASDYFYASGQFTATSQSSDLHGHEDLHRRGEAWQEQIVGIPAGDWVLKWSSSWDEWYSYGQNTLWVDNLSFTPGPPACWLEPYIYDSWMGGRYFYVHGALGKTYEVEASEDLQTWSPLMRVTCENFEAEVTDWKVGAAARYYRARAVP